VLPRAVGDKGPRDGPVFPRVFFDEDADGLGVYPEAFGDRAGHGVGQAAFLLQVSSLEHLHHNDRHGVILLDAYA